MSDNEDDLLPLYRQMSTPDLRRLAMAFRLDKEAGADATFCERRLLLIARVLGERNPQ